MEDAEELFKPAIDFPTSSDSVLLYNGESSYSVQNETMNGTAEVRLDFIPSPRTHIYGTYNQVSAKGIFESILGSHDSSILQLSGHKVPGFKVGGEGSSTDNTLHIKWAPSSEPFQCEGTDKTQVSEVVFHLFNFPEFLDDLTMPTKNGNNDVPINVVNLEFDAWTIRIRSLPETPERVKRTKSDGGTQLTHIGQILRSDGATFSGSETNDILISLQYFLSFSCGEWCRPICPVGYDSDQNRVWQTCGSPEAKGSFVYSWFDYKHGDQLISLFPKFMRFWTGPDWRVALQEVIYWYLNANNSARGVDAGLILSLTALERLSYEYAVKYKKQLSHDGFDKLRASDKIRLFCASLNIPTHFPDQAEGLLRQSKVNGSQWDDAPHALTEIRNALVHPKKKERKNIQDIIFEAWNLSQWLLEMGLLAVCGYDYTYGNRLTVSRWTGAVERVPWNVEEEQR